MSGLLNHPPERIIQQVLVDLGGLVTDPLSDTDWPAFAGNMPDQPDNCVAIIGTEGVAQGRVDPTGNFVEKYGIQVRIRSNGPVDGYVKASNILRSISESIFRISETVADAVGGTASVTYLVQSVTPTSGVIRLGPEPGVSHRYIWTINALASITQTS